MRDTMLVISSHRPAPVTVALPGDAALTLKPWSAAIDLAGRRAYGAVLLQGGERAAAEVAFTIAAAVAAATGWSGVVCESEADPDGDAEGAPADATEAPLQPAAFDAGLLEQILQESPAAWRAVDTQYVIPAMARDAEKNASSPSLAGGTPAGVTTIN